MNVENILTDYKLSVRKILLLKNKLEHLEKISILKTTHYSDDVLSGKRQTMYDKYEKMMSEKEELKLVIASEELSVAAVEKTLELLADTHLTEVNALKLRYLKNKTIPYIAQELGYSERGIVNKIKLAKEEFKGLYQFIA